MLLKFSNAKEWPKKYSCSFLEPGLCSYEDVGCGVALLEKETIDTMLNSFVGKPVVIYHQDVTPKNLNQHAVGYVTDVRYNVGSGKYECDFLLTDDKAKEKVANGYSVSCAYDVKKTGSGGEWHAIKYNERILAGEFTHLALVPNPRYEDMRIFVNSKMAKVNASSHSPEETKMFEKEKKEHPEFSDEQVWQIVSDHLKEVHNNKEGSMFKFFWQKKKNDKTTITSETKLNSAEVFVDIDGEKVSVARLLENAKKLANEDKVMEEIGMNDKVADEEGGEHSVQELVNAYKASKKVNAEEEEKKKKEDEEKIKKQNAEAEEKKKKEDEEKENARKNTEDEEKKKKEDEEKKNAEKEEEEKKAKENAKKLEEDNKQKNLQHFIKLNSLKETGEGVKQVMVNTLADRIEHGKDRYGTKSN